MIKPNFISMNKEQLRQYLIQNQHDQKTFNQYIDRIKASSRGKIYSHSLTAEEIDNLVSRHIQAKKKLQ